MAAYFINSLLLLVFFDLFYKKVDFFYPLLLIFFVFFISITVKWFRYKSFSKDIDLVAGNALYKLHPYNNEQKKVKSVIEKIHYDYLNRISVLEIEEKEKERLISQFVHSLKTPVTVIDIAASSLIKENEEEIPALRDIIDEKSKMLNTLDNILCFMRLDEFSSDYLPDTVNLDTSLRNIINSMKRNFVYGHVIPKVEAECQNPIILTDEKWNSLMLEQFISNGIKYSMAGEDLKPLLFKINRIEDKVILKIIDQGIGIPEYDLSRISEPFFTGENGRKVKNSSGIGLYIAFKIAHKLNHKIEITSTPGLGTEIKIGYMTKL